MVVFLLCFEEQQQNIMQCSVSYFFSPPKMAYIIFLLLESSFEILSHRITYYQGSAQETLHYAIYTVMKCNSKSWEIAFGISSGMESWRMFLFALGKKAVKLWATVLEWISEGDGGWEEKTSAIGELNAGPVWSTG